MRVPVLGGGGTNVDYVPPAGSTTYSALHGNRAWTAAPDGWYQVVPIAGIFSHLLYAARGAPGAGKSSTIKLFKNGVATALSVTIEGAVNKGEDILNNVSAVDGDLVIIQHVPFNTPSLFAPKHMVFFTPTLRRGSS